MNFMKTTLIVCLIIFSNHAFGQSLKNDLSGSWVCNKIIDSLMLETNGEFGKSNEYLKFTFKKSNVSITEAPFDNGIEINFFLNKKDSIIDLFSGSVYSFLERKYKVKYISEKYLILQTKNFNNKSIFYVFTRQNKFPQLQHDTINLDCGTILIKHLKLDKNKKGANRVAEYFIKNNSSLFYPSPHFDDWASSEFGHYFSINFSFPDTYPINSLSKELIVGFDVTSKGAENINILQSCDTEIDQEALRVINKSKRKWKPVKINGKTYVTKLKLHFYFYLGTVELPNVFK